MPHWISQDLGRNDEIRSIRTRSYTDHAKYRKVVMIACKRHIGKIALLAALLISSVAVAETAELYGTIMASEAAAGARGVWRYELRVTWQNNSVFSLSHLNLKLDDGTNCDREDITAYLRWDNPVGTATSFDVNGTISFNAELEMSGDPSLMITEPIIKFEPNEFSEVRPGPNGVAVFTFWSDLPPWPIDEPNDLMSEKFGLLHAFGRVEGVFPALPCDPIATEQWSWGMVKAGFNR